MDLSRASVKALFYDYPVDTAIQIVTTGSPLLTGEFAKIVNARERCYTQASMDALRLKLREEWMGGGVAIDGIDEMLKAIRLPYQYAQKVLDSREKNPTVKFDHLFRWSELTRYVGEDLMTVNYLAKRDDENATIRDFFEWDAVLPHNEGDLNKALRADGQGWCDVHLHLGATTDVFELSWVSLMNHIQGRKEDFSKLTHPLDSPVIVTKTYNYEDLYKWCVLAAVIRWELYQQYIRNNAKAFNESFEKEFSRIARQVPMYFRDELRKLQCLITEAGKKALRTSEGAAFDYAIVGNTVNKKYLDSPFMIYHGERYLLYQFYRDYWKQASCVRIIGKYVYLYELIKNQLRRELLQVNDLPGLGNFQAYNIRKGRIVEETYRPTAMRYAACTTMMEKNDGMEARITPLNSVDEYINTFGFDYHQHLFGGGWFTTASDLQSRMTFVVHFLKKACSKNNRHAKQRELDRRAAELLMEKLLLKETERGRPHRIVGIDVAGGETNCRPEVFAHLFRYCRRRGMQNFTYHVGEDFYDVTEGLRSIDEAVKLLQLKKGNRLGHCLALGIDAKKYYDQRHRTVVMPRQTLLDNIVWLLCYCECQHIGLLGLTDSLEVMARNLYEEIGYGLPFDIETYRKSMLLRGNDIEKYQNANSSWLATALDDSADAIDAGENDSARLLCFQYFTDPAVFKNGFIQTETFKIPYQYERVVKKVQNRMLRMLSSKKICIETNPTSNVRIGRLEQYDELPSFRFSKIRNRPSQDILITVNTDDKGIFGTSLHREFSLLALALMKQRHKGGVKKWDKKLVYQYIGGLASAGQKQRFRV